MPEDDDDDVSAMWREHHAIQAQKRADNRESSPQVLKDAGVPFKAFSDAHLRVADEYDFWPGTGLWKHLKSNAKGRGVRKLIARISGGKPR